MIIFKDILDDRQEFFCDQSFKFEEEDCFIKVQAKQITKPSEDLSSVNIGANPSAEGEDGDEGCDGDSGMEKCIDICYYHKLEEKPLFVDKKSLRMFIKGYINALSKKFKEDGDKASLEELKKSFGGDKVKDVIAKFTDNFDEFTFYAGENFDMPAEMEGNAKMYDVTQGGAFALWNEDGTSLSVYFLKLGLREEKV